MRGDGSVRGSGAETDDRAAETAGIGMILRGPYPHDVRVRKEATALAAAGYDVHLLCLAREDEPHREVVDGMTVTRFDRRGEYSLPWRAVKTFWFSVARSDCIWRCELDAFVTENRIDVLHVHDLPLARTARSVADAHGLPLVVDLHENFPEAARQWRDGMPRRRRAAKFVFAPVWRLKRLERRAVRRADRVVTVVEEAREHYLRDCGADPRTTHVVSNTVDLDAFDPDDVAPAEVGFEASFVAGYVGSFGPHRGLETVIEAFPAVVDAVPGARLLLVGGSSQPEYDRRLRELAETTGVGDRITFTGWVNAAAVPAYMAACDVGLVPHASTGHTATTVPHKLFQYMALGVPVLVTDVGPLGRIVRGGNAGRVVPAGDPSAAANALVELASDPMLAAALGANARETAVEEHSWADDSERLVSMYRDLLAERTGRD